MIVGTAGHIDHGKTALVKALTGVDCDRLKEEQARGITIDLGFAYLPTASGNILGFIDVPGHERFVHTMLAGATGIDFALLTVAADDGVKPQTREHLAIIDLLGVRRGVIAVTKADLATSDRLREVAAEIRAVTAGTVLEDAEILPVSAVSGDGIETLRAHLIAAAAQMAPHTTGGRFRLAVDRVFTLAGLGVIVTGTVLSGVVRVGDQVTISPSGLTARVRSIHAQNRSAELGKTGDRCALNLSGPGISKDAIERGDVVLDPALHAPTNRIDAILDVLASETTAIGQWFPVRLHHAATEVGARIALLEDKPIRPGSGGNVQLVLDQPIAAGVADRFVIRDVSAQRTIGGGTFVDLRPPARKRRTAERTAQRAALAKGDAQEALAALLEVPPYFADITAFARDRTLTAEEAQALLADLKVVLLPADGPLVVVSAARWQAFRSSLSGALATVHAENPEQQGIGREHLRLMLTPRLPKPAFLSALQLMADDGAIAFDGAFVRLTSHQVRLGASDEALWRCIAPLLEGATRFRPPRVRDIATATGRDERDVRRLLKLASGMGWADKIAHDHFFLRETTREMVAILADIASRAENGLFTAADLRDQLDNGRKVAIQILEFFDRHGVTLRKGDLRRMNRHRMDLFGPLVHCSEERQGGETSPVGRSDFKSEWGSEPVPGGFDSHPPPPVPSKDVR